MLTTMPAVRRAATAVAVLALLVAAPASADVAGSTLIAGDGELQRKNVGHLAATLTDASGPIAGQSVVFDFDSDGDGTAEAYPATTDGGGMARAEVVPTRAVGATAFTATWTAGVVSDTGAVTITDTTTMTLSSSNPSAGQVTDRVTVAAALVDSDGGAVAGGTVNFTIGSVGATATTASDGTATASIRLSAPAGEATVRAVFFGSSLFGSSADTAAFTIAKEDTALSLTSSGGGRDALALQATLAEDGAGLAGATVVFQSPSPSTGAAETLGTATTDAQGVARLTVPPRSFWVLRPDWPVTAAFAGDSNFHGSTATTTVAR